MREESRKAVQEELARAQAAFPPMRSYHEGYAIIAEELDELWEEVKKKPVRQDKDRLKKEAVQVAAMAIRFLEDLCP